MSDSLNETQKTKPPAELTIRFDAPIEFNGKSYPEIVLKEPQFQQVKAARLKIPLNPTVSSMDAYYETLVQSVSGLPPAIIALMPITAMEEASRYLGSFFSVE